MGAAAILTQVQTILAADLPTIPFVYRFPPAQQVADTAVYLLYDGYTDLEQRGPGVVLRTHHIRIRLLVRAMGSDHTTDETTETTFLGFVDLIADAFYTNRTLSTLVNTSHLIQSTGPSAPPPYLELNGTFYRQMEWTLEAQEQKSFVFA